MPDDRVYYFDRTRLQYVRTCARPLYETAGNDALHVWVEVKNAWPWADSMMGGWGRSRRRVTEMERIGTFASGRAGWWLAIAAHRRGL